MPFNQSLAIASALLICFLVGILSGASMGGVKVVDTTEASPLPPPKPEITYVFEEDCYAPHIGYLKKLTVKDLIDE